MAPSQWALPISSFPSFLTKLSRVYRVFRSEQDNDPNFRTVLNLNTVIVHYSQRVDLPFYVFVDRESGDDVDDADKPVTVDHPAANMRK